MKKKLLVSDNLIVKINDFSALKVEYATAFHPNSVLE